MTARPSALDGGAPNRRVPAGGDGAASSDGGRWARVVVVDDNAANVALLERLLEGANLAELHAFTDPRKALEHCAGALPDMVLLDMHMPHLDGFAVIDALRAMSPADRFLPVLVLTADVTATVKQRTLAAGARTSSPSPSTAPRCCCG
jgi:CheY-like chemotaxis protein